VDTIEEQHLKQVEQVEQAKLLVDSTEVAANSFATTCTSAKMKGGLLMLNGRFYPVDDSGLCVAELVFHSMNLVRGVVGARVLLG